MLPEKKKKGEIAFWNRRCDTICLQQSHTKTNAKGRRLWSQIEAEDVDRNREQIYRWVNLSMDKRGKESGFQPEALCTDGTNVCPSPTLFSHNVPFLSSPGPLQMLFCSNTLFPTLTPYLFSLLIPTYPQFRFLTKTDVSLQDDPGPPTAHLLVTAFANFNHYLYSHDSLIQFCFIYLSLLIFPIHLINFSFSWKKKIKINCDLTIVL